MEYGGDLYAEVEPGTTVVTNVFLAGTSEVSHQLASAFGVGAMELGKHKLDPAKADIPKLVEAFGNKNVARFQILVRGGFNFFYLPNA